jgi:hypothetical protein
LHIPNPKTKSWTIPSVTYASTLVGNKITFVEQPLCRRFLDKIVRKSLFIGMLLCAFPVLKQAQQLPIIQAPEGGTSVIQASSDEPSPGTISGTVVDGTDAIVVGARVTLICGDESESREVLSGADGQFFFSKVPPGPFQIRIAAPGFSPQTSSGILHSGEFYFAPADPLAPATVGTAIEVTIPRVEAAEAELKAAEKQRLFGVVPNFYVTYLSDAPPLNAKQKWELAWKSTIDPVNLLFTAVTAGAQQAQNEFSGYGQGAQGYTKRFAANFADNATSTLIGSAFLPALFKQDPRYFYKGTGGTKSRILYAMANAVVCKGDNGRWQANYSAILGGLASGAISNLYYPPQDRGATLMIENTVIGTGETALFNIFQEFFSRKMTPHVPRDKK